MLTREQLLGSFRRRYAIVPTIAGDVRIQNMSEAEKADYEAGQITTDGKLNLANVRNQRRKLIAMVVVDEAGKQVFDQPGDIERLKELDSAVTTAIWDAACKHCGFSSAEVDELRKNYEAATDCDSLPA